MKRRHARHSSKTSSREFNPDDAQRVRHTKIGVWDLYEEIEPLVDKLPGASKLEQLYELKESLPFVWRMLKDIGSLKTCWSLLVVYIAIDLFSAFLPAVALWYSSQLLQIVESAIERRSVDESLVYRVVTGRMVCAVVGRLAAHFTASISIQLDQRIKAYYAKHIFEAYVRLDLPTFEDSLVRRQLESAWGTRTSVAWTALQSVSRSVSTSIRLVSEITVLVGVLHGQRDGLLIASITLVPLCLQWMRYNQWSLHGVFAATCRDDNYLRTQGMKGMVAELQHRKEIVAGSLHEHLSREFTMAQSKVVDGGGPFHEVLRIHRMRSRILSLSFLNEPFKELPLVIFAFRAAQYPLSIPVSLASLNLTQSTVASFSSSILIFFNRFGSISEQIKSIRQLYEIQNIPNKIIDGTTPYPEDELKVREGLAIEFRNVYFRYPGSESLALENVSFKIQRGQLCVIVGANGSGKSTVLKLVMRLYDPEAGEIFVDGRDIKEYRLNDLRQCISVLFQDYTHFPLSIAENIGLGDPSRMRDRETVEEAARLGGAYDFITKLPDGFDTYLERPVPDFYSSLPDGTKTLFGRPVDHGLVRSMGRLRNAETTQLSGGQMQRLALSRTFMRSLHEDNHVGLLLFDEPSASLDPAAEHDLFERLRSLRGGKTMLFSSHRFGNLTRHADVILFMKDSTVKEFGTHDSLLKSGGGYAQIYTLQAKAFL